MPTYSYRARDETGKMVKGLLDAFSKDKLVDELKKMGFMATKVMEVSQNAEIEPFLSHFQSISVTDMVMFNIQLSNMISAGISVLGSLEILKNQIENTKLKEIVHSLIRNIDAGESFSQALSKHPSVFSTLFINMIKAGEVSGQLDTVLARFAEFYERQVKLAQKVKGALFYPVILLFTGVLVTLFLVTSVIPQFAVIFSNIGIELPQSTMILYKTGVAIKSYWHLIILSVTGFVLLVKFYVKTDGGKRYFDKFKLRVPLAGTIYRKAAVSRFARTLGTLIESGVPILESLAITKNVLENVILAEVIDNVYHSVEEGKRIAESLKDGKEFPSDLIQMISIGEESGNLGAVLNKVADFYDTYVERTIMKLTAVIEPVFLVILGTLVGFIMISILTPMFDMVKILKH